MILISGSLARLSSIGYLFTVSLESPNRLCNRKHITGQQDNFLPFPVFLGLSSRLNPFKVLVTDFWILSGHPQICQFLLHTTEYLVLKCMQTSTLLAKTPGSGEFWWTGLSMP